MEGRLEEELSPGTPLKVSVLGQSAVRNVDHELFALGKSVVGNSELKVFVEFVLGMRNIELGFFGEVCSEKYRVGGFCEVCSEK